jgi:hypothetical protein
MEQSEAAEGLLASGDDAHGGDGSAEKRDKPAVDRHGGRLLSCREMTEYENHSSGLWISTGVPIA